MAVEVRTSGSWRKSTLLAVLKRVANRKVYRSVERRGLAEVASNSIRRLLVMPCGLFLLASGVAMADCVTESDTVIAANKALVQGFYDAINAEDWDAVAGYTHKDFLFYPQVDRYYEGAEGFIRAERANFDAYDDWRMPIVKMTAECNTVMAYLIFEGTHARPTMGLEPSGNPLRFSLMMMLTIKDGKILEKRAHYDRMDIVEQLTPGGS